MPSSSTEVRAVAHFDRKHVSGHDFTGCRKPLLRDRRRVSALSVITYRLREPEILNHPSINPTLVILSEDLATAKREAGASRRTPRIYPPPMQPQGVLSNTPSFQRGLDFRAWAEGAQATDGRGVVPNQPSINTSSLPTCPIVPWKACAQLPGSPTRHSAPARVGMVLPVLERSAYKTNDFDFFGNRSTRTGPDVH